MITYTSILLFLLTRMRGGSIRIFSMRSNRQCFRLFCSYEVGSISATALNENNKIKIDDANVQKKLPVSSQPNTSSNATKVFRMNKKKAGQRDGLGKPKGYFDTESRYLLERGLKSGQPSQVHNNMPYLVLGIESSCDDTGVAIVSSTGAILSNVIYSQYEIHERFGGVVPSLAMEAHKLNIDKALDEAVLQAGLNGIQDIDAIAVTKGPGLEICLRVGLNKAVELATMYKKPLVTVHHLEAHCMVARMAGQQIINLQDNPSSANAINNVPNDLTNCLNSYNVFEPKVEYPFLTLLASGGHTAILLSRGLGDHTVLGGTLDDALGEAFDKVARMLGIKSGMSGGAAVEKQAELYVDGQKQNNPDYNINSDPLIQQLNLKVPMRDIANCDFSYAGLKNAMRMAVLQVRSDLGYDTMAKNAPSNQMETIENLISLPSEQTSLLCAGFQNVAIHHVEDRIKRALHAIDKLNVDINGLVVVGGVAANKELRNRLLELLQQKYKKEMTSYELHTQRLRDNIVGSNSTSTSSSDSCSPTSTTSTTSSSSSSSSTSSKLPKKPNKIPLLFPPPRLCTDNGVMVAWTGIEKLSLNISDAVDNQHAIAKWPFGALLHDESIFKKN